MTAVVRIESNYSFAITITNKMYFLTQKSPICGEFISLRSAIKELQHLNSCEVLNQLCMDYEKNPPLVFVDLLNQDTQLEDIIDVDCYAYFVIIGTHHKHAQSSIRLAKDYNIRDFLNAPLTPNDIQDCLDRYFHCLEQRKVADKNNLVIKEKGAHIYIETSAIKLLEGFGSYTRIHTADKVYIVSKTIKKILELLPNQFIRTHRSFAVHQKQVRSLMGNTLLLHNGEYVKVSKAGRQVILNHFNKAS
jgi:DNA-binding LytR/AlgR family response regulator